MFLDERSSKIFKEIVLHPGITTKQMAKKLDLSRPQIDYSIKRINDFLKSNSFEGKVKRLNTGSIQMDDSIRIYYQQNMVHQESKKIDYVPNQAERVQIIILILLSSLDNLSIVHFTSALQVSKNTVIRDVKNAKDYLSEYGITLEYSRSEGYSLKGKVIDIRKLIDYTVVQLFKIPYGDMLLKKYAQIDWSEVDYFMKKLEQVEKYLEIKYSDNKIWTTCYILILVLRQIKNGVIIEKNYNIMAKELSDTKEYAILNIIIDNIDDLPDQEKIYITLHLLSLSMNQMTDQSGDNMDLKGLMDSIRMFLNLIEQKTAIDIKNRDELAERLFLHLKPAYYRIKYDLTIKDLSFDNYYMELENILQLVRESLEPLESFVKTPFPEQEILLLSMFVAAYLSNSKEDIKKDPSSYVANAIIVCPNGVIASHILENNLKKVFPNLLFRKTMSSREFELYENNNGNLDATIIFSTIPLKSKQKIIIVDENLSSFDTEGIINSVSKVIKSDNFKSFSVDAIMKVIHRHLEIDDTVSLEIEKELSSIYQLLQNKDNVTKYENQQKVSAVKSSLYDFLQCEFIQIVKEASWQQALSITCEPLLENNFITIQYLDTLNTIYPTQDKCIDLSRGILIPHAKPEEGANQAGFSLLKIENGIDYKESKIHFIITISAVDKEAHIEAMFQLLNISSNETAMELLKNETDKENMREIIKTYQNVKILYK